MYKIKRVTVFLSNGDRIYRKVDRIAEDTEELESIRLECKQKFEAEKVNLSYEEVEENC
ncbi:MAG: hypothetical protein FWF52_00465 [Candidatus Azobacteroides sp.]|nr:hypothetical protein [Candidatus Azobacteroides sp.]